MSLPKFEELRSRVKAKVAEVRTRVGARGLAGQQMKLGGGALIEKARARVYGQGIAGQQMRLGGGALVEQARRRADVAARRMAERKPGIIPMVKEFRPGERLRQFFPEITDNLGVRDMAIEGYPAKPSDHREMAVFVE
jgi:hypothetical protein